MRCEQKSDDQPAPMNSKNHRPALMLIVFLILAFPSFCQVRLPRLIGNGMVLQRESPVKVWGWAAPHENISVRFIDSIYKTIAGDDGEWTVILDSLKAGGPHEMQISATNIITLTDILIGDVWICSGQSNMELPMRRVSPLYPNEIAGSDNPFIRLFRVPQKYNFKKPENDLASGSWVPANPQSVLDFSAVAYFFAHDLYEALKVPIGLVNASLGGSAAECWLSEEALRKFPEHYREALRFRDSALITRIENQDRDRIRLWHDLLNRSDQGYGNPDQKWSDPTLDVSDWDRMKIPGYWANTSLGAVNGVVWFRKDIRLPASMAGQQASLILGRIIDADSVFVNGTFIGTTSYQYPPRRYTVPAGLLKKGKNTVIARVISTIGEGGFVPDKPYEISAGGKTVDLKGRWRYHLGVAMEPLAEQTFIRWKPLGLYNAMIHPLLQYRIKGVIWYQGESNAERPAEYAEMFPVLIQDWRAQWKQGDFPFLFVQLPGFMEPKSQPGESNWALFREAQLRTLSEPNTGMAVAIDIGEWNDIHPLNKKDVGKRLALAARKVAYGEQAIVCSGPAIQSMAAEGKRVTLTFTNIGTGLMAKGGGKLKHFAIAGADHRFVWAKAKIVDDKVVVWNRKVKNPVEVRYAWADNPGGANLCNREGLPASPFRVAASSRIELLSSESVTGKY